MHLLYQMSLDVSSHLYQEMYSYIIYSLTYPSHVSCAHFPFSATIIAIYLYILYMSVFFIFIFIVLLVKCTLIKKKPKKAFWYFLFWRYFRKDKTPAFTNGCAHICARKRHGTLFPASSDDVSCLSNDA